MRIYIFKRVENVSENYHTEGGLVVIAKSREAVNRLIANKENIKSYNDWGEMPITLTKDEWDNVISHKTDAKHETAYIFPDAGCC